MQLFILLILLIILFFSIVVLFFSFSLIIGLVMTRGVPFISSPSYDLENICQAAQLKPGEIIYDLGCGKANLLTLAAQKFQAKGVGYELSLWPYFWGKLRTWLTGVDVKLYLKNFFEADLSNADVIFCYLFPEIMAELELKFQSELKKGARVVSYAFKLPNVKPAKIVDGKERISFFSKNKSPGKIYVYQF